MGHSQIKNTSPMINVTFLFNIPPCPDVSFFDVIPEEFKKQIYLLLIRQSSEKYSVCVAWPTVFLDKMKITTKIWVGESENSNIKNFGNFRILSREKTSKHLPPVQRGQSIYALLISISFYSLETALAESIIWWERTAVSCLF